MLRPNVKFQNGRQVTAPIVREILLRDLPSESDSTYKDIKEIRVVNDLELEFVLRRRSSFLLESLDLLIRESPKTTIGTGPFTAPPDASSEVVITANDHYYEGKPTIDQVVFRQYGSVRAAWADMLRGEVDMLYEIGQDAFESLQPSSNVRVFTFQRSYAHVVILNTRRPLFRRSALRRALNMAIDRSAIVSEVFDGHATPATGPISPNHWAYDKSVPAFSFSPDKVADGDRRIRFRAIVGDPSNERLALLVQRQLQAIGVDLELEMMPLKLAQEKMLAGDFDAFFVDAALGPTMIRPYRLWYSGEQYNWTGFSSSVIDAALDEVRAAPDDNAYKAGIAAFQRAVVEDPPVVFLVWSERSRAVSSRFEVTVEPGRDITSTLRQWRPAGVPQAASRN